MRLKKLLKEIALLVVLAGSRGKKMYPPPLHVTKINDAHSDSGLNHKSKLNSKSKQRRGTRGK